MLKPFFAYLLLHPSPSPGHTHLAVRLHSDLLTLTRSLLRSKDTAGTAEDIVLMLMRSLALQPITTASQLMAVVGMTMDKVGVVCSGSSVAVRVWLLDGCLALCCELSAQGLPMAALLGESKRVMEGLLKEVG